MKSSATTTNSTGRLRGYKKSWTTLLRPYQERLLEAKLQSLPAEIRVETKAAVETPKDKRDEVQQFLVKKFGDSLENQAGRSGQGSG